MAIVAIILVGVLLGSAIALAVVYMTVFSRKEVNTTVETNVEPVDGTFRSLENDCGSTTNTPRSVVNATTLSSHAAAVAQSQGGGVIAQLWSHILNIAIAKSPSRKLSNPHVSRNVARSS